MDRDEMERLAQQVTSAAAAFAVAAQDEMQVFQVRLQDALEGLDDEYRALVEHLARSSTMSLEEALGASYSMTDTSFADLASLVEPPRPKPKHHQHGPPRRKRTIRNAPRR